MIFLISAVVYTVKFQSLPHAHILLFVAKEDKSDDPEDIDRFLSVEIPDKETNSAYYNDVQEFMMHGPCGATKQNSPCMRNGFCGRYFP